MTPQTVVDEKTVGCQHLLARFRETRRQTMELVAPLAAEDFRVQSMRDVSPPWWNLGHTTWFFAKNILESWTDYRFPSPGLEYVLNSYYEVHGERLPRAERGLVTRPTNDAIFAFRREVDRRMEELIQGVAEHRVEELDFLVTTGIQHEQQHQELLVTELKHILGTNHRSLRVPYRQPPSAGGQAAAPDWVPFEGGLVEVGNVEGGWCWDVELPVHRYYLEPFALLNRLVTVGEFREFIADGGYRDPLLWLANGWDQVQRGGWKAPLYWEEVDGAWQHWTLWGDRPLDPGEPVCHVSFYEADAFARWKATGGGRWAGCRLPTEAEWEEAGRRSGFRPSEGNCLDRGAYHPLPAAGGEAGRLLQMAGDLWEWTSSHYEPYPGYAPYDGALMEYNGKFMDNQRILRGGSCATPANHLRVSYRNFWPAATRFQLTGIRLAQAI